MATILIVHGAFGGGWEWHGVARLLRDKGHDVLAPSLTGHGERIHLASAETCLETHIQDTINTLIYAELNDVVLVGQSYGGMVITGVADRVPGRLAHLVYLDALVPCDGQSVVDLLPAGMWTRFDEAARTEGEGWRVPPPPFESDPRIAAFARGRYVASPLRMFTERIWLTNPENATLGRTYIWCTEDEAGLEGFATVTRPFAERARLDPSWRFHQLTAIHDAFIDAPEIVADLIDQSARRG